MSVIRSVRVWCKSSLNYYCSFFSTNHSHRLQNIIERTTTVSCSDFLTSMSLESGVRIPTSSVSSLVIGGWLKGSFTSSTVPPFQWFLHACSYTFFLGLRWFPFHSLTSILASIPPLNSNHLPQHSFYFAVSHLVVYNSDHFSYSSCCLDT